MRNTGLILLLTLSALSALSFAQTLETEGAHPPVEIVADYAVSVDYPLVKSKFAVFNSGWVPLDRYERDIPLFDEVRPQSLRVDLGWGFMRNWPPPISGTPENLRYDFAAMDRLAQLLNQHNVQPYWAYCYVPSPLQSEEGNFRSVPVDAALWGQVLGVAAQHFLDAGEAFKVGYHEVYNEPDNRDFLLASAEQYIDMYRHSVRHIRQANPDAVVGGPALAFTDSWVRPFLHAVTQENLPLDFFSYHYYPSEWEGFYPGIPEPDQGSKTVQSVVEAMRAHLSAYPQLACVEMHLNEFNAYPIDYPRGGRQDRYPIAPELLHAIKYFLTQSDLTQVHWAQFMDTGGGNWSGMITRNGRRKALFNAFKLYMQMPTDRRQVSLSLPDPIEAMAATNGHQAGLLFWNQSSTAQEVRVVLQNLPFAPHACQVYRIDEQHASYGDNRDRELLEPIETAPRASGRSFAWSGRIPDHGIVYLTTDDGSDFTESLADPVARIVREHYYFPRRGRGSYANFDRHSWTLRLGMGPRGSAWEQLALVLQNLPKEIHVAVELEADPQLLTDKKLLALRLDYQVDADYTHAVLFRPAASNASSADSFAPGPSFPWGAQRSHDAEVTVNIPGRFTIPIHDHAPEHWTGRLILTAIMHDFPPHARAKILLR